MYYEIAGFQAGEPIRRFGLPNDGNFLEYIGKKKKTEISYHDLEGIPNARTSETGQMVISKSRHFRALVLALYYNYYGPDTYYPLFYQGGAGEGDKDTFIPALEVFQEPYTVVDKDPLALGFKSGPNMDGDFVETTITQYAPTSAKYHLKAWKQWLNQKDLDTRLWPYQSNEYTKKLYDEFMEDFKKTKLEDNSMVLEPMFLHAHKPKINPFVNYENKMGILEKRNFGSLESLRTIFGDDKDWELRLHAVSKWVVCEGFTDNKYYEKQGLDRKEICEKITNYVDYLKKTTTVANFDYLKVDSEDFNNKIKQTDDGDNESPKDKEEDKSNNDNKDTKDTEDTEKE